VEAVAGVNPHELLRIIRMKHAAELLLSGELNVTQVMYMVGMRNTSNFAQSFRRYFGINPSEYRHSRQG
jgi:AraC-like DNA-binding protein